jgi:hypothetical protein
MKCPRCGETLPFILCPECGEETPAKGNYCCRCGSPMKADEGEIDFSQRVLCSDGSCIGVINEKRVCNVCGKPYIGEQQ